MSDLRRQHQELLSVEVYQKNLMLKLMIELLNKGRSKRVYEYHVWDVTKEI